MNTAKGILKKYLENDMIKMSDYVRKRLEEDIEDALDRAWGKGEKAGRYNYKEEVESIKDTT